ncbi:DDE-type integrase/transposase/recombinase [Diaphorobacter caeni]|uniref:DDE-type integrase/transposase/recombinase n=1 Tax=Diaphorobacter caeni TaxID=2784387 RepID=UPI00188F5EB3|nr:DDE-type integrase/transposase/recombinase [Diaphorobacter caeni]MBF5006376.1 DDE-type integrase/transposase/recombinase [Diaphorobacter caeni]
MPLNATLTQRLVEVAALAATSAQGGKQAIYADACRELSISLPTLYRHLKKVTVMPERKQRSDAGDVSLPRAEAVTISALLMVSHRKTNKRLMSIGQALEILRTNGEVRAERTDPTTGEVLPLSDSAVARALRHYGLHPDQLNRPEPAVELRSLHPNHVWQIDASLCVLYYLNARTQAESGLQVMERDKFYKNKPANLKRIEADRVWSYEASCHNSGSLYLEYVFGAESADNLTQVFINAIQQRANDPFYGVPFILMMDMGSANTSGLFKNLARRLQVQLIAHAPGNARATGQIENGRNLIERSFESGLRLAPVQSIEELNTQARRWARWFNANKIHSRHGKTRFDQWMTIAQEQLRIAPSVELCRELLTHEPESRKVSDMLTVSFKGRDYDVRSVPQVMVGEKLAIAINPWMSDAVMVVEKDSDGNEVLHSVPVIERDDAGFRVDGNVIGEDWNRHADTVLDTNRKEVAFAAYDVTTQDELDAARKSKAVPFGGRIDPYKPMELAPERTFLPRQGAELTPAVTTNRTPAPARILNTFEAALELRRMGLELTAEKSSQIKSWYPDGVPEDELQALHDRLTVRAGLRVVAGGA